MNTTQDKESILTENKLLIDMTVMSVCNGQVSGNLENYLLLAVKEGWQQLVDAVRLILNGERQIEKFSHLDEEDIIVIEKILEILNKPDVLVQGLLLSAQQQLYKSVTNAHELVRSAIALTPDNPLVHAMMGQVLHVQNQLQKSADSYRKSLAISKEQPQVLLNLGVVLNDLKRYEEAILVFRQVLEYQPDNLDAMSHLAYLYERSYMLDQAVEIVNKGLSINSQHPTLTFISGKLQQRNDNKTEAIQLIKRSLELSLTSVLHGDAYSRLGYLYDRAGETQNSIECFTQANSIYTKQCQEKGIDKNTFNTEVEYLNVLGKQMLCDSSEDIDQNTDPVFLIGFPRSGTTLLNQILDSHGEIQTLEEKPLVASLINKLYELSKNQNAGVLSLDKHNALELRKAYFNTVSKYMTLKPGNIFIDKFPLNIAYVPVISKVFPDAKYILALRHPCDACLSCFMHSFGLNSAMMNFTSIEDTVSLYVKLMSSWEEFSATNNIKFHRIRYEDTIENFQYETDQLLKFLRLDWDDKVNAHTENARSKGFIDTPSYDQVTKPLYKHAIYRWHKYKSLFEAHLDDLEPLIKEYGY